MRIPLEIAALIDRLSQELSQAEQEAIAGVNLVRPLLLHFSDNIRLIQFFALFNNTLLFVEISRRRIQATVERISAPDVASEEIQQVGEDLGTLLGQLLETKNDVKQIMRILEELR